MKMGMEDDMAWFRFEVMKELYIQFLGRKIAELEQQISS